MRGWLDCKQMSSFPYRLAAIDLDETLLDPDKKISDENAQAVRSLVNATNCSGCSHSHYVARRHSKKRGTEGEVIVGARLSAKDNDSEPNRLDHNGGEGEISAGFDSEAGVRQIA